MGLVEPSIGLIFWMTLAFLVVWVGLGRVAWPAILQSIKEREASIQQALDSSSKAKDEVENLKREIEEMKKEARIERENIIKEARDTASKIIAEKQEQAQREYERKVAAAESDIQAARNAAVADVKELVAKFSVEIAEKILRKELANQSEQKKLVDSILSDLKLN
jgi:F-type H+-transporting ATPase subunit b